jgi:hypothetical protein
MNINAAMDSGLRLLTAGDDLVACFDIFGDLAKLHLLSDLGFPNEASRM